MAESGPDPAAIDKLEWAVWPSFALLAGVQLDLFTHLKDGSMSVEQIARRVGVRADKLKPLLYALAAVGLLTVESGVFSTPVQPIIFSSREMRLIGVESMS